MIDKKIIIPGKQNLESVVIINPYSECGDCGTRVPTKYGLRFNFKHKYIAGEDIERHGALNIPIDSNHVVSFTFSKVSKLLSSVNNINNSTIVNSPVIMESLEKCHTQESQDFQTAWKGRNSMYLEIFKGLGIPEDSTCISCYDEDFIPEEDEDGDLEYQSGLDIYKPTFSININYYKESIISPDLIKRFKGMQRNTTYVDIPREINLFEDFIKITIGDIELEIDNVGISNSSFESKRLTTQELESEDTYGLFLQTLYNGYKSTLNYFTRDAVYDRS